MDNYPKEPTLLRIIGRVFVFLFSCLAWFVRLFKPPSWKNK